MKHDSFPGFYLFLLLLLCTLYRETYHFSLKYSWKDSHLCAVLWIRIERLELFDEFEEWHMMQVSHSIYLPKENKKG